MIQKLFSLASPVINRWRVGCHLFVDITPRSILWRCALRNDHDWREWNLWPEVIFMDNALSTSHDTNTFGKGINKTILSLAKGQLEHVIDIWKRKTSLYVGENDLRLTKRSPTRKAIPVNWFQTQGEVVHDYFSLMPCIFNTRWIR